ncbi:MAG: TonB family protein, partial [Chromatiales bacterium]|nr:TonB family protein [Chromatiales bacterium]
MKHEAHIWVLSAGLSVGVHLAGFAVMTWLPIDKSPDLHLPAGDASGVRVHLLSTAERADAHDAHDAHAVQDVIDAPNAMNIAAFSAEPEHAAVDVVTPPPVVIDVPARLSADVPVVDETSAIPDFDFAVIRREMARMRRDAQAQLALWRVSAERLVEQCASAIAASPSAPESSDALTVSVAEEIGEQTGGVDRQPVASPANVPPVYPRDALRRHQFGTVVLLLTIDVDGRVFAVEVATSSGVRSLDA